MVRPTALFEGYMRFIKQRPNVQKRILARVKILAGIFLLMLTCLDASRANAAWSYPKNYVLEYFSAWRTQISDDRYLEERERDLRLELIDRLSFQIDRKYSEQDFRLFLIDVTEFMALTDETSANKAFGSDAEVFKNLNASLKEILEPSENILSFIRSFVEFSGLKSPKTLESFAESRSYTNGLQTESATTTTLDEAARQALEETPEAFESEAPSDSRYSKYYDDLQLRYDSEIQGSKKSETGPTQFETRALEETEY